MLRHKTIASMILMVASTGYGRDEPKVDLGLSAPSGIEGTVFYGQMEFRHHTNTFYDADGYLISQEPSVHVRARVGGVFYDGLIDAYLTGGMVKTSRTQQILQRRPEFEIDVYPWRGRYGRIVQYNIVALPFSDSQHDPELADPTKQGSIFTFGVSPILFRGWQFPQGLLRIQGGSDWWTEMYSRTQYRPHQDDERDRFALNPDEGESGLGELVPADALSYFSQYMVGVSAVSSWLPFLEAGISAHYDTAYLPQYRDDGQGSDHRYIEENSSHYRLRLRARLSSRVSFVNDYYHYYEGAFGGRPSGADDRRMRNIARLTVQL